MHTLLRTTAVSLLVAATATAQTPPKKLDAAIASADSMIEAAIAKNMIPGAVFVVSQNGQRIHERAFGFAELNDMKGQRIAKPRAMHTSTLFDLASVTKVMATTFAIMRLVDQGKVDVDAPVHRYLPDFRGPHLDSITVRHLLTHSSGLVQWQPLYYHASNKTQTYKVIREMSLQWGVGEGRHYSDLGFMLLGFIVERVSGTSLDAFVTRELYGPLGLTSLAFNPKKHGFTDFAATEQGNGYEKHMVYDTTFGYDYNGDPKAWNGWRTYVLSGETNDGNSWYANGGVAGHAGLFGRAADLRVLLDLLVNNGSYGGRQYIKPATVEKFFTLDRFANYLGWMHVNGSPDGAFAHTGFTGTYVMGIPNAKLSIVLLTNKQNVGTDAKGNFSNLAPLQAQITRVLFEAAR